MMNAALVLLAIFHVGLSTTEWTALHSHPKKCESTSLLSQCFDMRCMNGTELYCHDGCRPCGTEGTRPCEQCLVDKHQDWFIVEHFGKGSRDWGRVGVGDEVRVRCRPGHHHIHHVRLFLTENESDREQIIHTHPLHTNGANWLAATVKPRTPGKHVFSCHTGGHHAHYDFVVHVQKERIVSLPVLGGNKKKPPTLEPSTSERGVQVPDWQEMWRESWNDDAFHHNHLSHANATGRLLPLAVILIIIGLILGVAIVTLGIAILLMRRSTRKKSRAPMAPTLLGEDIVKPPKQDIESPSYSTASTAKEKETLMNSGNSGVSFATNKSQVSGDITGLLHHTLYLHASDASFNIDPIKLQLGEELGKGFYGKVRRGMLRLSSGYISSDLDVAVKTVSDPTDPLQFVQLLKELNVLSSIGRHPNIVAFAGAVVDVEKQQLMVVTELCAMGSLLEYLKKLRPDFEPDRAKNETLVLANDGYYRPNSVIKELIRRSSENPPDRSVIASIDDLLKIAEDVASGMDYLGMQDCIHRDLAARNVLLTDKGVARLSDFGLAKHQVGSYYRMRTSLPLPLRWMSVESIIEQKFDAKSDAWAFGIVLFEIFSLGCVPYPDIRTEDLVEKIISGTRNAQAFLATDEIYSLMTRLWDDEPAARPPFQECADVLRAARSDQ